MNRIQREETNDDQQKKHIEGGAALTRRRSPGISRDRARADPGRDKIGQPHAASAALSFLGAPAAKYAVMASRCHREINASGGVMGRQLT